MRQLQDSFRVVAFFVYLGLGSLAIGAETAPAPGESGDSQDELTRLRAEVKVHKATIQRMDQENKRLMAETQALKAELAKLKAEVAKLSEQLPPPHKTEAKPPTDVQSTSPRPSETTNASKWDGFRGIKWGTNIRDIPGMKLVEQAKDSAYYMREEDSMKIGDAELSRLVYGFYKNRFCTVMIASEGSTNWYSLRDAVFAKYGKGSKDNQFIERYNWGAPFPGAKEVSMTLEFNEVARKATIWMGYEPLMLEKKQDQAKTAKDAGKDF